LALAEKYFGFTELADDLLGGVSFSWHLTLFPFLILTLQLDQFLGVRSQPIACSRMDYASCISRSDCRWNLTKFPAVCEPK
jgi:hypothetical protein